MNTTITLSISNATDSHYAVALAHGYALIRLSASLFKLVPKRHIVQDSAKMHKFAKILSGNT